MLPEVPLHGPERQQEGQMWVDQMWVDQLQAEALQTTEVQEPTEATRLEER